MRVEVAVMKVILDHVKDGKVLVPVHLVETAHPKHTLSGRARLRGLRQRGIVRYEYDEPSNCYRIHSSLDSLELGMQALQDRSGGRKPVPSGMRPIQQPLARPQRTDTARPQIMDDGAETDPAMQEEIRRFREELAKK